MVWRRRCRHRVTIWVTPTTLYLSYTMIAYSDGVAWNWSEVHSYQRGPDMMSVAKLTIKKCNDHIPFRRRTEDKLICFVGSLERYISRQGKHIQQPRCGGIRAQLTRCYMAFLLWVRRLAFRLAGSAVERSPLDDLSLEIVAPAINGLAAAVVTGVA